MDFSPSVKFDRNCELFLLTIHNLLHTILMGTFKRFLYFCINARCIRIPHYFWMLLRINYLSIFSTAGDSKGSWKRPTGHGLSCLVRSDDTKPASLERRGSKNKLTQGTVGNVQSGLMKGGLYGTDVQKSRRFWCSEIYTYAQVWVYKLIVDVGTGDNLKVDSLPAESTSRCTLTHSMLSSLRSIACFFLRESRR